jgi:hypothetical protein
MITKEHVQDNINNKQRLLDSANEGYDSYTINSDIKKLQKIIDLLPTVNGTLTKYDDHYIITRVSNGGKILHALESLTKPQLKQLINKYHVSIKSNASKHELIKHFFRMDNISLTTSTAWRLAVFEMASTAWAKCRTFAVFILTSASITDMSTRF